MKLGARLVWLTWIGTCSLAPVVAAQPNQAAAPPQRTAPSPRRSRAVDPARTCRQIADELAKLGKQFPQLARFRASSARLPTGKTTTCAISYQWHTHRSTTRGGWSAAVPHPDPDGVWFYVGIFDPDGPDAGAQIHSQPVTQDRWLGAQRVMFLVLDGANTRPIGGAVVKILERHGMITR